MMGEVALASLSSTFKPPLLLHGSRTRCALGKEERKGKQKNRSYHEKASWKPINQKPIKYSSRFTSDLPLSESPWASFDQYLEDESRILKATFTDGENMQVSERKAFLFMPIRHEPMDEEERDLANVGQGNSSQGKDEWRIQLPPLQFLFLTVQPIIDMRLRCKSKGKDYPSAVPCEITKVLELEMTKWELLGLDDVRESLGFSANAKGAIYPDRRATQSWIKTQFELNISFVLPPSLALVPKDVIQDIGLSDGWRIQMPPLQILFLTVWPIMDMRLTCKSNGKEYPPEVPCEITKVLELETTGWKLLGIDNALESSGFNVSIKGALYPDRRGIQSRIKNQFALNLSFILPPTLLVHEDVSRAIAVSVLQVLFFGPGLHRSRFGPLIQIWAMWMPAKIVHDSEIIRLDRSLNNVVTVIPHDAESWRLHPKQGALGFIQVVQVATEKVKLFKFRKSLVLVQLVLTLEKQQLNLSKHAHQDHCHAPEHLVSEQLRARYTCPNTNVVD
uniref:Uncharacterized protein n=1 Tax=Quercus lobata TaxID=97700 RepID=A0A7N2KZS2_QUELO